jgi:hypothetical protein
VGQCHPLKILALSQMALYRLSELMGCQIESEKFRKAAGVHRGASKTA